MRDEHSPWPVRLYLIGALILLFGLAGSAVLYVTADDEARGAVRYELGEGEAYTVTAAELKSYRHDLEHFGGRTAVLLDDFSRWFAGLWQGRRLARTLAILSIIAAAVCFRMARRLSGAQGEDRGH